MKEIWKHGALTTLDIGYVEAARIKWLAAHNDIEGLTFQKSYDTKRGMLGVIDVVAAELVSPYVGSEINGHAYIVTDEVFICVQNSNRDGEEYGPASADGDDDEEPEPETVTPTIRKTKAYGVTITGHRSLIGRLFAKLDKEFSGERQAQIKWWYTGDHGETTYKTIFLEPLSTRLEVEFYPDLKLPNTRGSVHPRKYLKSYLESDAAILMVAGAPGTGKTTLLRHLICDFNLAAHVVYDEKLMNTDKVFQSFLFESRSDVLVIEDADTILTDREHSGNKLMSRFLNVSDGLIKLPNKRVVFTTNISDFGRVDPALIRPGRCFDTLRTRPLNLQEAQAVAKAAQLGIPSDRHEYTLAELFNNAQGPAIRKVGF
jgi:hypothetical protein